VIPSPRALLGVAPALIVAAGSFALARQHDREAALAGAVDPRSPCETVCFPTATDEDRLHRVALKLESAEDLMSGRLTLAEAVERFETWAAAPEARTNLRTQMRGRSDRERAVNQVVAFVRTRTAQEPARFAAALVRVEAEAKAFIAHGPVAN
jgi:hypothetical protein